MRTQAHRRTLVPAAASLLTAMSLLAAPSPPARAAERLGQRALGRGDHGADVRELQRTLRRLHLAVHVDGRFGRATDRSVRRYERRVRVPVDGAVSPGEARGMRARTGTLAFGQRTLRRGAHGKDVRRLQTLLTALGTPTPADGHFGTETERSLRRQERTSGLTVDGRLSRPEAATLAAQAAALAAAAAQSADPSRFPIAGPHHAGGPGTGFGDRHGRHQGVDLFAACGTPLVAPVRSTVARVAFEAQAGNYVVLHDSRTGEDHVLMHLRHPASAAPGEHLAAGAAVGEVGQTGNADGCHLHYEIWTAPGWYRGGSPRDPTPDLQRAAP